MNPSNQPEPKRIVKDEYSKDNCQGCALPITGVGYLCGACIRIHKKHVKVGMLCPVCLNIKGLEQPEPKKTHITTGSKMELPDAQAEVGLQNSVIHMALLAWKNGDITMIELKQILKADKSEAVLEEQEYLFSLASVSTSLTDFQNALAVRIDRLQPPTAGEGESV